MGIAHVSEIDCRDEGMVMSEKRIALSFLVILFAFVILSGSIGANASNGHNPEVTFERDVASIFQNKCIECHHAGGSAPMSLVSYNEARPWARAIKEKVVTRTMPPFYVAGPIGYYADDIRLTQEEIDTIVRWVDTGAPRGNPSDRPKMEGWLADKAKDEPDLVLTPRKPYTIKNNGEDDFQLFAFDHVFTQDTWIKGIEVRPGNKSAVHHVVVYLLPDSFKAGPGSRVEGAGASIMGAEAILFSNPGSLPKIYEDGTAILIKKGLRLGIQVHYAPTTNDNVVDQTSLGIYYANGVVNRMVRILYGGKANIEIPAGEKNYQLTDYKKFKTNAIILTFGCHMHLRGKSFTIRLIYPDGRRETVFEVPQFYFNWQRSYALAKPLTVPKGAVAEYVAVWDNSSRNRFNPDPTRVVRFGFNTTDEMMGGSITYVIPEEELGIQVKDGVKLEEGRTAGIRRQQ
jgi:hypothetical protein